MPVNARNPFLERRGASGDGTPLEDARELPLALIDPNPTQARQSFDETALAELAESIRTQGVIQPIVVRPTGDRYQIIAGERRTRAATLAGLTTIPAIIRADLTEAQAAYLTAVENLQREDLDIEDEARQYAALQQITGLSGRALAAQLGKGADYINRRLGLLRYPDLMEAIRMGLMTQREGLQTASYRASKPEVTAWPAPWDEDAADDVTHRASLRDDDSTSDLTERAVLDPPELGTPHSALRPSQDPAPPAPGRIILPWRRRPLDQFADWVARTPPAAVPPAERASIRDTLSELRNWLDRWEAELANLPDPQE